MKKLTAIALSLLMLLSLCACGASAKSQSAMGIASPAAAPAAVYADSAAEMAYDGGFASNALAEPEMPTPSPEEVSGTPTLNPDKIIYSAGATVETTDFEGTVAGVNALVKTHGGFIESSSVNGTNFYNRARGYAGGRSAYFTLRIPSAHFNELMNSLSTLGNVPYTHTYTENISSRYYDTEARLKAYRAQETSLLAMMEKAESVEDIIAIEDKLSDIRYNIESLQTTLNGWDRQVEYSTVELSVEEVREYTPEAETPVSYGSELILALKNGLRSVGEFFKELLVWLVGALPVLVILAVLFFVLRRPVKKLFAKRRARKQDKE